MRGKTAIVLILILSMVLFTGCDWTFFDELFKPDPCKKSADSKHCYQDRAVEENDPSLCKKIKAPKEYKTSNPPKDKCYMMVAQATGEVSHCGNMKGGEGSYTKEECVNGVAKDSGDTSDCNVLRGEAKDNCIKNVAGDKSVDDINSLEEQINEMRSQVVNDPKNRELRDKLEALQTQKTNIINNAAPDVQRDYWRQERERIFEDIEDADVKSAIARDFMDYRKNNPEQNMEQLIDRMEQIKEEKETIKRLDEEANKIMDDLKNNIIEYGTGKANEAVEEAGSAAWKWTFKKGSEEMKWQMSKLERMKDAYDRGSAQYNALKEKYDKIKKVYDEVNEVYGKVQNVNKLLADGKIDEGKAQVLKGAVYLGKGLEHATSYIPIFGSTASTVSKEMFDATVKLATKRAQRTTAINKCIDDPLNCDPNGISGY